MATYCPSLTDVNNLFASTINQFDRRIYAKFYMDNPYMSMFPRMAYDYSEGRIPRVLTGTYELPTDYPIGTAIGSITINSGTGNFCAPDPTLSKKALPNTAPAGGQCGIRCRTSA
jgi:hypothetical protein